jgi:hypothetical protein
METISNGIRKVTKTSPIEVSRVYKSEYQKPGTLTAELKQTVTTTSYYPTKSVTSNMQDNIFNASEFGFEEKPYEAVETRVTWIDVPANATVESVKAKLSLFPKATIYRVLANKPIITNNQVNGIAQGFTSKDAIAMRQVVRYPKGHEMEGKIATDSTGAVQYRSVFFSAEEKQDIDMRTADKTQHYTPAELIAEMSGNVAAIAGQTM